VTYSIFLIFTNVLVDEMGIAESDEESDGELDSTAPTGKVMKVNG
jgi:hypothetical protein